MGIIRDSFVIFKNWDDAIRTAPEDKQLELYHALMDYAIQGELPENISWEARMFLMTLQGNMQQSIVRYAASVENGKLGGRPKKCENLEKPNETQANLEEPKRTNPNLEEPTHNLNKNDNDNVNKNVYIEKENSLTRVKESEESSPSTRRQKHKYGKFKNVLLTEDEYKRLLSESDGAAAIEYFSEYREIKGYKSRNDNLAIRKWAFDAVREKRFKAPPQNESQLMKAAKRLGVQ